MNEKELRLEVVNTARKYVGVVEGSSTHRGIIDTYNQIKPLPVNYMVQYTDPWCATFVSFIAKQRGLLDIIPAECSCPRQIELWKKMSRWEENDAYVPEVGDIIYYSFKDKGNGDCTLVSDHVGIVEGVYDNDIKVIEGNYSDSVKYRTLSVNGRYIRGFGKPNYASRATSKGGSTIPSKESVCQVNLKVLKLGSKNKSVKALQMLLVGHGYSVGSAGVDGDFGNATCKAVKKYQTANCLDDDGVVGELTWAKLLGN